MEKSYKTRFHTLFCNPMMAEKTETVFVKKYVKEQHNVT